MTIQVSPEVEMCISRAALHQSLAADASTDEERRAHEATMRSLDKAAMEIVKGNTPRYAGQGMWLVESRTQAGTVYRIDLATQQCSCKNGRSCWHLAAANICDEVRSAPSDALPAVVPATMDDLHFAEMELLDEAMQAASVNEAEADAIEAEESAYRTAVAGVTDDMVIAPPEKAYPQSPVEWAVFNASHAFVVREISGDAPKWVECVRREDALNIAAALNHDPFAAGLPMESNGVTLFVGNMLVGIASSAEFAREVCNAWTDAWIPF